MGRKWVHQSAEHPGTHHYLQRPHLGRWGRWPTVDLFRLVLTVSLSRTLTGTQQKKMCSQVSVMTSCFSCVLLISSGGRCLYTYAYLIVLGGIPDLLPNQPQKSQPMIEKFLLVPSILPKKASLLLAAQTRYVQETVPVAVYLYHVCFLDHRPPRHP